MTYGEKYNTELVNRITKERTPVTLTYKRAAWNGYHTNDNGEGLWHGDKQILGTAQFSVTGCSTEKTAVAKIRNYINRKEI